jgi:Putative phage abortive infection protein
MNYLFNKVKTSYQNLISGNSPEFAIWLLLFCGLIIFLFPFLFTQQLFNFGLDFRGTGAIGDTIGGITSPFISLLGAVITFFAFWIQVKANKTQTKQFDKQDISDKKDRFEIKFYDLLKIHRENVNEIKIEDKVSGRNCFIQLVSELRFIYCTLFSFSKTTTQRTTLQKEIVEERLFNISYLTFFFGIGKDLNLAYRSLLSKPEYDILTQFHILLLSNRESYKKNNVSTPTTVHEKGGLCELIIEYSPFNGHSTNLGHYFRHLFQIVKLIIDQDDSIIQNKYEYFKILRAQLSTHEQLLLFYNIQSILGKPWESVKTESGKEWNIVTDFRFIKNIPLPFADFYKSPKEVYGTINSNNKFLFEWDEITKRFNELPA